MSKRYFAILRRVLYFDPAATAALKLHQKVGTIVVVQKSGRMYNMVEVPGTVGDDTDYRLLHD